MEGEVKKCPRQTRNCNIETSMPYNVERIAIQYENTCTISYDVSDTMNCNTAKVGGHSRPSRAGPSALLLECGTTQSVACWPVGMEACLQVNMRDNLDR